MYNGSAESSYPPLAAKKYQAPTGAVNASITAFAARQSSFGTSVRDARTRVAGKDMPDTPCTKPAAEPRMQPARAFLQLEQDSHVSSRDSPSRTSCVARVSSCNAQPS